jgi:hypothetical protein
MDGDDGMIKFLLSTRGKKRGYTTGSELDIRITDVTKLSDDELDAIVKG